MFEHGRPNPRGQTTTTFEHARPPFENTRCWERTRADESTGATGALGRRKDPVLRSTLSAAAAGRLQQCKSTPALRQPRRPSVMSNRSSFVIPRVARSPTRPLAWWRRWDRQALAGFQTESFPPPSLAFRATSVLPPRTARTARTARTEHQRSSDGLKGAPGETPAPPQPNTLACQTGSVPKRHIERLFDSARRRNQPRFNEVVPRAFYRPRPGYRYPIGTQARDSQP